MPRREITLRGMAAICPVMARGQPSATPTSAADRFVGTITNEPINDERDAYHQSRALADMARWINSRLYDELVEQERRKKAERCKLRAVESQDNDDDDPDAA